MKNNIVDVDALIQRGGVTRRAAERAAAAVEDGRIEAADALGYALRDDAAASRGVSPAAAAAAYDIPVLPDGDGFRWA